MNRWRTLAKVLGITLLITLLALSPLSSSSSLAARNDRAGRSTPSKSTAKLAGAISETSPPSAIQALRPALDEYQPQVKILSPKANEVLGDNTVSVRFQVNDLPIFKNEPLGLGPHLHVFLDDQPYQAVYNLSSPLVLENLTPGTHTLRVFASRPWHESFKNEGAYAQTTFHVFTKTQDNSPDSALPLLTYSRPQGSYGAEPIMLDFYLTNAPLHFVAQESDQDDIVDWRIRCTVNGNSFLLDRWQPIYLKGFKPGKNWVQLEFLDEQGNPVKNTFNNTVRLITYEPNGQDTLSRLVRGELSAEAAKGIVDPNFVPTPPEEPTPIESPELPIPEVTPSPIEVVPSPIPTESPAPERTLPTTEVPAAGATPTPSEPPGATPSKWKLPWAKSSPAPVLPEATPSPAPTELAAPEEKPEPIQVEPAQPSVPEDPQPKPGFFNRFRPFSQPTQPTPSVLPSPVEEHEPTEPTPTATESPEPESSIEPQAPVEPELEQPQQAEPEEVPPQPQAKPGFFNRFQPFSRSTQPKPDILPSLEEKREPAEPTPTVTESPEPESSIEPQAPVEPELEQPQPPKSGFFNRFRPLRGGPTLPSPSPVPEVEPDRPQPSPSPASELPASPAVDAKPSPLPNFPDLAPSPIPSELEAPAEAPEQPKLLEPEQPFVKERSPQPVPNFFERLGERKRSTPAGQSTLPEAGSETTSQPESIESVEPPSVPAAAPSESPNSPVEETPIAPEKEAPSTASNRDRINQLFERLRQVTPSPSPTSSVPDSPGTLPEIIDSAQPEEAIPVVPETNSTQLE